MNVRIHLVVVAAVLCGCNELSEPLKDRTANPTQQAVEAWLSENTNTGDATISSLDVFQISDENKGEFVRYARAARTGVELAALNEFIESTVFHRSTVCFVRYRTKNKFDAVELYDRAFVIHDNNAAEPLSPSVCALIAKVIKKSLKSD